MSTDPLERKFPYESPYTGIGNNPVVYIDRNGKEKSVYTLFYFEKTGQYIIVGKAVSNDLMQKLPFIITNDGKAPNPFNMTNDWYNIATLNTMIFKMDGSTEVILRNPEAAEYRTSTDIDSEILANFKLGELFSHSLIIY